MTTSLVVALLAVQAVGPVGPDCRPESAAVREVLAVANGIVDADNARDLARVLGYYAADAVLLPPGEGPVAGLAAIRPRYVSLFEAFTPQIELQVDEVCAGDGLAFVRGRNRGRLVARAGGASRELDDAFVMLLRRGTAGGFRISHLIWYRQVPISGARRRISLNQNLLIVRIHGVDSQAVRERGGPGANKVASDP